MCVCVLTPLVITLALYCYEPSSQQEFGIRFHDKNLSRSTARTAREVMNLESEQLELTQWIEPTKGLIGDMIS